MTSPTLTCAGILTSHGLCWANGCRMLFNRSVLHASCEMDFTQAEARPVGPGVRDAGSLEFTKTEFLQGSRVLLTVVLDRMGRLLLDHCTLKEGCVLWFNGSGLSDPSSLALYDNTVDDRAKVHGPWEDPVQHVRGQHIQRIVD